MAWAASSFALGVALASWLPPLPPSWCAASAASLLLLWGTGVPVRMSAALPERMSALPCGAAAMAFFALLGALRTVDELRVSPAIPRHLSGDAVVSGIVAASPEVREGTMVLDLEAVRFRREGRTWEASGPLQVFIRNQREGYSRGDIVLARGRMTPLRGDRNYGWFPRPVDPLRRRLAARLYVSSPVWARRIGVAAGSGPAVLLENLRQRAIRFWDRRSDEVAPLLKALTTGQRGGLSPGIREDFRRSGIAHLLAVSGLHLGFLSLFLYRLLRFLFSLAEPLAARYPVQPLAAAATVPFLLIFYLFTGEQVSAGRAAVMTALGMAGAVVGRRPDLLNLVGCAALLMLFWEPLLLFSVSFQLSFTAATLLLAAAPRFPRPGPAKEKSRPVRGMLLRIAGLFLASAVASLGTMPLAAFHFQRVALAGPLANLIAIPLAGFAVLPLAWAAAFAGCLWTPLGDAVAVPATRAAEILSGTARCFASLPLSSLGVPRPPALLVLAVLAAALLAASGGAGRRRALTAAFVAAVLATALWAKWGTSGGLRASFLDVGQGEAAILRLPGGGTMLVDTGPSWEAWNAGREIVVPALRKEGVRRIDVLVLSHLHPDHCGGLGPLLEEFPVGEVWTPPLDPESAPGGVAALLGAWRERGGLHRSFTRGDSLKLAGGTEVLFLNPQQGSRGRGSKKSLNDGSLVMYLQWGGTGILMTGDISAAPSREVAALLAGRTESAVLKVPHHGGRQQGAEALAGLFGSRAAVISVGRNNYGHPHPDTVGIYGGRGPVLRTDIEGRVDFRSDGRAFRSRTWRQLVEFGRTWGERLRWLCTGL